MNTEASYPLAPSRSNFILISGIQTYHTAIIIVIHVLLIITVLTGQLHRVALHIKDIKEILIYKFEYGFDQQG